MQPVYKLYQQPDQFLHKINSTQGPGNRPPDVFSHASATSMPKMHRGGEGIVVPPSLSFSPSLAVKFKAPQTQNHHARPTRSDRVRAERISF